MFDAIAYAIEQWKAGRAMRMLKQVRHNSVVELRITVDDVCAAERRTINQQA